MKGPPMTTIEMQEQNAERIMSLWFSWLLRCERQQPTSKDRRAWSAILRLEVKRGEVKI